VASTDNQWIQRISLTTQTHLLLTRTFGAKAGASGLAVDSNGWPVTIVDRARLALALCSVVCFPQQYHFPAYVAMSIC
jgi:hypothetical protein